jgi:hypothetical protein
MADVAVLPGPTRHGVHLRLQSTPEWSERKKKAGSRPDRSVLPMVERVRGKATAQPGKAADPTFFRCGRREPESPSGAEAVARAVPEKKKFLLADVGGWSWNRGLESRAG